MDYGALIRQLQGILKFLAGHQINFGTCTISWTSGQTDSNNTTGIAHGLDSTPVVVWVFPIAITFTHISYAQAFSIGATTFSAAGYTPTAPGSNKDLTHGWIAIG